MRHCERTICSDHWHLGHHHHHHHEDDHNDYNDHDVQDDHNDYNDHDVQDDHNYPDDHDDDSGVRGDIIWSRAARLDEGELRSVLHHLRNQTTISHMMKMMRMIIVWIIIAKAVSSAFVSSNKAPYALGVVIWGSLRTFLRCAKNLKGLNTYPLQGFENCCNNKFQC